MSWMGGILHLNKSRSADMRALVIALAKLEQILMTDFTNLQAEVASNTTLIQSLAADVAALKANQASSAEQDTVDAIASQMATNNAAIQTILTPAST